MNNTVYGFNQQAVIDLHINDLASLTVLHWFEENVDERSLKQVIEEDGHRFFWMEYKKVLEDYPALQMTEHSLVKGAIKKLVNSKILIRKTVRTGGTYTCYAIGENYNNVVCKEE